ncbi:hypothetical protein J8M21_25080, partial [Pseudoalteromonas luteoviolacea]|uniref:hypothetical protein n=1 Tax=Pseudoalteromonas luteoviolacea TaxID=43657 RepID=UPI001B3A2D88
HHIQSLISGQNGSFHLAQIERTRFACCRYILHVNHLAQKGAYTLRSLSLTFYTFLAQIERARFARCRYIFHHVILNSFQDPCFAYFELVAAFIVLY